MHKVNHEEPRAYMPLSSSAQLAKGAAVTTEDKARLEAERRAADDQTIMDALTILRGRLRTPGQAINNAVDAENYLILSIAEEQREVFGVLWLDTSGRLIGQDILFSGTLNTCAVYPREVVKAALDRGARLAILFHNHPSGDTRPSTQDIVLTRKLIDILKMIEVDVHDHIIVAGSAVDGPVRMRSHSLRSDPEYWHWITEVDHNDPRNLLDIERLVRRGR